MALPFNPPNPYGAYFNFGSSYGGDPTPSLWRQPNYPNLGPVSQGVASAMGSPSGGINPTEKEFINTRQRDIAFQQFIDRAIKDDPRTRTMGNMLLDGVYGNDTRAKTAAMARVGGADAYNGMIGTIMNTPGLSGYFGGSVRSTAVGSLAVATSGLQMNGYGVFGDKSMNLRFADELMRQVNSRFYNANGNPNLSMTNGLNRDQMGGIMVQAASQGAFSGMDMGMFQKLDSAGNKARFIANGDTVNKITEFMKNASKALGSLIDVYGNISSGELMQKAQQITGLDMSRLENAGQINERIQRLRTSASVAGIDNQSAMDFAARAVSYGSAIGLRPEMAGTIGNFAANQGLRDYRSLQMQNAGLYTPAISPMERIQSLTRDQAAMSQDPLGSRYSALEMLIKNSGMSDSAAASLRSQASKFGATQAGVGGMDRLIQSNFGVSAAGLINGMGGPAALQQQLDASQQDNIAAMTYNQTQSRLSNRILSNMVRGGMMPIGSSMSQVSAMHDLATSFSAGTMDRILGAGSNNDLAGIINSSVGGDTASLINSAKIIRAMGDKGRMAYRNVFSSIQSDELTRGLVTREERFKNAWMDTPDISDDVRGQLLSGGFMAGIMDKYTGNDPQSQLMFLSKVRPDVVAGIGRNETIRADFANMRNTDGSINVDAWRKASMAWRTGLSKTSAGRALMEKMNMNAIGGNGIGSKAERDAMNLSFQNLSDPNWRLANMPDFDFFSLNNGSAVAFAQKSDMALKEQVGGDVGNLVAVATDLRKHGKYAEANMLMQHAGALVTGGNIYGMSLKGVSTKKPIGFASAATMAGFGAVDDKTMLTHLMSGDLSDAALKQINSTATSGNLLGLINDRERALREIIPLTSTIAHSRDEKIKDLEAAKKKLQGAAPGQLNDATTAVSNLTGTLNITDNQNGKLVAAIQAVLKNPPN